MVHLKVETAEHAQEVETDEAAVSIGRASRNTVRIADDQSSRQHCRLERLDDGSWKLVDLASRNGTYLNDKLVDEAPLHHGDRVRIGSTTITFELPEAEQAAAGPAEPEQGEQPEPQALKAIKLVFVAGSNRGRRVIVFEKLTTIGRRPSNDIIISDRGVSNRHAEVRRGPDGFILVDEGSRNGTFLNGRLVLRNRIAPGDQIRIGKTLIHVQAADAETTAQIAIETEGVVRDESGFITAVEGLDSPAAWPRAAGVLVAALLVAGAVVYGFRGQIGAWIGAGPQRAPDLLLRRGSFDGREAREAWKPDPSSDSRFEKGALALQLPSRGPMGALAACDYAEPLAIAREKRYVVAGRIRTDRLSGGLAGILATWGGEADWAPNASILLRPEPDGDSPWAIAERTLIPPPWADSLDVSCVAAANSGVALFDDVRVTDAHEPEELPRLAIGPLRLVMDTPVLFSLSHDETYIAAGAGVLVAPGQGAAALRQMQAQVASGYPKKGEGRYQVRSRAALPPQGIELFVEQTLSYRQGGLRLDYRVWTAKEARVEFAGLELPCPAAVLSQGVDVRTASGFYRSGRDERSFVAEDAYGLTWHLERGKVFLASEEALTVEGRTEGARGVVRIGRRDVSLRTAPLTVAFTVRGTTPEEERKVVSRLVAAERAARQGRYGEALGRYQEIAKLYPHRRATSETARRQLAVLRREAVDRLSAATRLLARAELTGEGRDFDAARAGLEPLVAGLQGTPHAPTIAEAVARCGKGREQAERRRLEGEARLLLSGAREQHASAQPHIARLYCRELLARYPDTDAAGDARALLEERDQPPPPKPAVPPAPKAGPTDAAPPKATPPR